MRAFLESRYGFTMVNAGKRLPGTKPQMYSWHLMVVLVPNAGTDAGTACGASSTGHHCVTWRRYRRDSKQIAQ